ncbi:hypothetical protein DFH27DRAFT_639365 [Peziza echinospora]|nr:hypothetical protein DFH27DRAFT_639365 [Peziza echinospora]
MFPSSSGSLHTSRATDVHTTIKEAHVKRSGRLDLLPTGPSIRLQAATCSRAATHVQAYAQGGTATVALLQLPNNVLGVPDCAHLTAAELSAFEEDGRKEHVFRNHLEHIRSRPVAKQHAHLVAVRRYTNDLHRELWVEWAVRMAKDNWISVPEHLKLLDRGLEAQLKMITNALQAQLNDTISAFQAQMAVRNTRFEPMNRRMEEDFNAVRSATRPTSSHSSHSPAFSGPPFPNPVSRSTAPGSTINTITDEVADHDNHDSRDKDAETVSEGGWFH